MSRSGGEAVAQALAAHGVELVWGIPGTHNLEIYAHLTAAGIRHVLPRHEQGAAFAADGFARVTGRPGRVHHDLRAGGAQRGDRARPGVLGLRAGAARLGRACRCGGRAAASATCTRRAT